MFYGTQKLFCPVGNDFLGTRNKNMSIELKCDDCQFYYVFAPSKTIPIKATPARDKEKKVGCDCGGCQDRDSKKRMSDA